MAADQERERAIIFAGEQMQAWMAEYERTGCFAARGTADYWLRKQTELVRERSPEQAARMERERGLAA